MITGRKKYLLRKGFASGAYLLLCMLCCYTVAAQQQADATLERNKIVMGEQVELLIKTQPLPPGSFMNNWFAIADTFNTIEVIERGKVDTLDDNGSIVLQQKLKITSFDSGYWQIPAFTANINNVAISTSPLALEVIPADVRDMKEYHDIKEILEVQVATDWRIIAAIAAAAVVSISLLIWLLTKRRQLQRPVGISLSQKAAIADPYEWALQQLETLKASNMPAKGAYKDYYTQLVIICRVFSDKTLNIDTDAYTTDEYMARLKGWIGTEPAQTTYFQLLRLADAVKFAKYQPTAIETEQAIPEATQFIKTLHQFHKKS